jgi:hypothetical protein
MTSSDELIPISSLFFDGPGPHVVRAGFPRRTAPVPQNSPPPKLEATRVSNAQSNAQSNVQSNVQSKSPSEPQNAGQRSTYTPARGQDLQALLNTSIMQLGAVSGETRRKTPVRLPPPVEIDSLLYSGRSALERALEVRDEIVAGGSGNSSELIQELLDLVVLAARD